MQLIKLKCTLRRKLNKKKKKPEYFTTDFTGIWASVGILGLAKTLLIGTCWYMRCWWYQSWPKMKKSNTWNFIEISIKVNILMKFQWNSIKFPKSQEMSKKFNGNVEIPWLFKKIQLFHFQLENHFTLVLVLHASPPELNSVNIAKMPRYVCAYGRSFLYFIIFIQLAPMGAIIYIFHTTCAYGRNSIFSYKPAPMGAILYFLIFIQTCTYGHISLFKFIEIAPMCVIIYVNIFLKFLERKLVHQQKSQKQLLKVVSKIKRRLVNPQVLFYYFYFFYISRSISTECFSCW